MHHTEVLGSGVELHVLSPSKMPPPLRPYAHHNSPDKLQQQFQAYWRRGWETFKAQNHASALINLRPTSPSTPDPAPLAPALPAVPPSSSPVLTTICFTGRRGLLCWMVGPERSDGSSATLEMGAQREVQEAETRWVGRELLFARDPLQSRGSTEAFDHLLVGPMLRPCMR